MKHLKLVIKNIEEIISGIFITAASSAISPVIPPGINLIIYALIANVSVGKMFMAGYVPGLLMCLVLMVTVTIISKKRGYMPTNKWLMLLIINVLLLAMGMFIEGGAALIIIAPLVVPVVVSLGVNPIHFGVIAIVNIMIGGVTPPFGSMMFTTCSITNTPIPDFIRESLPMIGALLIALLIVTFFPALILFLHNLL